MFNCPWSYCSYIIIVFVAKSHVRVNKCSSNIGFTRFFWKKSCNPCCLFMCSNVYPCHTLVWIELNLTNSTSYLDKWSFSNVNIRCPGFGNRLTIKFIFDGDASANSFWMVNRLGFEHRVWDTGLYWFKLLPYFSVVMIVLLLDNCVTVDACVIIRKESCPFIAQR